MTPTATSAQPLTPSFREAFHVWLRVAALSFGGPAGQIAVMHRIVVEEKKWIDEQRFLHALNFCMLLPGPEAQQLATYLGWLLHGVRGGLVAGILFILPGFLSILALSYLYVLYVDAPLVTGLFLGLKAAVLALVLQALRTLAGRALNSVALKLLALLSFVALALFALPFPLLIVAVALLGMWAARYRTHWLGSAPLVDNDAVPAPMSHGHVWRVLGVGLLLWALPLVLIVATLGREHVLAQQAVFFGQVSVVTFGGAYAVLAYVAQQAVEAWQWLAPGEMLDGLGMAESTPGPLIQVLQFVGFLASWRDAAPFSPGVAAFLGASVTTWAVFVPCFIFIFAGAPYVEALRHQPLLAGALRAITAAVVGVIASLALWFAGSVLFASQQAVSIAGLSVNVPVLDSLNWPIMLLVVAAWLALARLKWGTGRVLVLSVCAGMLLQLPSF